MSRPLRALLLALPALSLGVAGLFHPAHLTAATAQTWWALHVPGLFVFPLVGVAFMALVRGRRDAVAVAVVVLSFGYAAAYTALDVLSGIGAGYVTDRLGPGVPRPEAVTLLFRLGDPFGLVGAVALLLATLLLAADALWRWRGAAIPSLLLVPGAGLVWEFHIFAPNGVLGMLLLAAGTGWLAWLDDGRAGVARDQNSRSAGSSMPRNAS